MRQKKEEKKVYEGAMEEERKGIEVQVFWTFIRRFAPATIIEKRLKRVSMVAPTS